MSKEAAKQFVVKLQQSEQLQLTYRAAIVQATDNVQALIDLAEENGFIFTKDALQIITREMVQKATDSGKLDDAQLEAVAGGSGWSIVFPKLNDVHLDGMPNSFRENIPGFACPFS